MNWYLGNWNENNRVEAMHTLGLRVYDYYGSSQSLNIAEFRKLPYIPAPNSHSQQSSRTLHKQYYRTLL